MQCSACGASNPEQARFCGDCGASLAPPVSCPHCGATTQRDQRFCHECGGALGAPPAPAPTTARKVVTIVFADLTGSTALHERLDAESVRRFMDAYYLAMRGAVETHGGTVTQLLGDGVKAVFGAPRVAEDDAIRAVRAAVEMQRAFAELAQAQASAIGRTGLRVAVNTGEVVASEATEIIGDPVNVAARLQEQARDGDVVIGESTRRLVSELVTLAPLGVFALKGRSETVAAYRVVSLERPAGASATPFVGRDAELRGILAVHDDAVASRRARLAVVLGSPGLGKSRVIGEVARRLADSTTVLSAHCDAAGSATFAPIADALRACLRIEEGAGDDAVRASLEAVVGAESDDARVASGIAALLAGAPASPEETFFVVRRFLAALAATRPVVLAIDDLQWAEPLLLDLTEHLVQWTTDAPLFVLVAARPELREARSALAARGGLVAEVVTLAGLDALAAMKLAANAIGADELPAAVAGRVLATSEGNPLFVGELVRMLVQDGVLKREGSRWIAGAELAGLEMPPTIQALLAARIERLRPEERTVLERAAVIGRHFSRAAVKELLPRESADLDRQLEALRRSELVEPDPGWFLGEPALRFHHVLIRDAAYRRLLKNTRAELHERFADWVEQRVGEAAAHDETLGWHLEQAHSHLRQLGPLDAHGKALGERASRVLAEAGRRALARDDVPLAASLLGRSLDALDPVDAARAELALDWCEALLAAGEVGTAATAIDELGRFADDSPRLRAWHTCFAGERAALVDPQALRATVDAVAAAADELAAAADTAGEAKAHFVHAIALSRLGRVGACEAALDRALSAARRSSDGRSRRRANAVLSGAPQAALWGPSPVTRASGRCLDVVRVLRITQGAPAVEAIALRCQGVLEALRGRSDAARRMIATSRRMVEELGITQRLLEAEMFAGQIDLIEGDAPAAEARLRPAYEGLREHGLGIDAARAAALLGRALLAQDRAADAEALSHESEALAGDDLSAAVAWRGVRAEALARRGEHAAAIEFARAAVDIAAATDALLYHADARTALAVALRAAGRGIEAAAEDARAIELWEAKGATLLAERARREAASAVRSAAAPTQTIVEARPPLRRLRANAATAAMTRLTAAAATRDFEEVAAVLSDTFEAESHTSGLAISRQEALSWWRLFFADANTVYRIEPLAALGNGVALGRESWTGSAGAGPSFEVGVFEMASFHVYQVDAEGRLASVSRFGAERLGDAVAELYQRHAELLSEGPERDRATATARTVAATIGTLDRDRLAAAIAPDIQFVDHRTLGVPSATGADAFMHGVGIRLDLADGVSERIDEVLCLEPTALLARSTNLGTIRASGGAYENHRIELNVFGGDGRVTHCEHFDANREADALARFDALTAEPAAPIRRVRPNAATERFGRVARAMNARDVEALEECIPADTASVDRPTGRTMDRREVIASLRGLFDNRDLTFELEPIAALGNNLAVARASVSARGVSSERLDVGSYVVQTYMLSDVTPGQDRTERFGADYLGDAIVRLYERYAEQMPAGPERDRAAATARSVAVVLAVTDAARWADAISPAVEWGGQGPVSYPPGRGASTILAAIRKHTEVGEIVANRTNDVLALQPSALLRVGTTSGIDRVGGGAFETSNIWLLVFGADGLLARVEYFEPDRAAEALARFDELTAEPTVPVRRVQSNAATERLARLARAMTARDPAALEECFPAHSETVDHPTGGTMDRRGSVASLRGLLGNRDMRFEVEHLAALGDALALARITVSAGAVSSSRLDVGSYIAEMIHLDEVEPGRHYGERFGADLLGDAVVRLYERHAERMPAGGGRERAAAIARCVATVIAPLDPGRWAAVLAPDVEWTAQGPVAYPPGRGASTMLQAMRGFVEIGNVSTNRVEEVCAHPDVLLLHFDGGGSDREGGLWQRSSIIVLRFAPTGLISHLDMFEPDRMADALARFDALTAEPVASVRRVKPNAATAFAERTSAAFAARDIDAIARAYAPDTRMVDHMNGDTVHNRDSMLDSVRLLMRNSDLVYDQQPVATLGDALVLSSLTVSAPGASGDRFDVGPYANDLWIMTEVDAAAQGRRSDLFAGNRLGDAVVRLYERHAELLPAGPERDRAAATARSVSALRENPDRWLFAEHVELIDHRSVGIEPVQGREAVLASVRALFDMIESSYAIWDDVLAARPDALVTRRTHTGTDRASGGAFERALCVLLVFGADGLVTRWERFDPDRATDALARFDALAAAPPTTERRLGRNAATANLERLGAAFVEQNADAIGRLLTDSVECVHHPTAAVYERQGLLTTFVSVLRTEHPTFRQEFLATLGDSLALSHMSLTAAGFAGQAFDVGFYDREEVCLVDVDATGRQQLVEFFAVNQLGNAVVRLYERHAEQLPSGPERDRATATARTVAALREPADRWPFAPDVEAVDHRNVGFGSLHGSTAVLDAIAGLLRLTDHYEARFDDVLALRPDALLVRWTHTGTDRTSHGAFERRLCVLWVFGSDGRVIRWEQFDGDDSARALARFDALTADSVPPPRRVHANMAAATAARLSAAMRTARPDALGEFYAESYEGVDHATGAVFERQGVLASLRNLVRVRDPEFSYESLATLGGSLALSRSSISSSGFDGGNLDVGPYEVGTLSIVEVDAATRVRRNEFFAHDRLGDAVVRLYERHSEMLAAGAERDRTAAIAHSLHELFAPLDPDRWARVISPDIEFASQGPTAFPGGRGAEVFVRALHVFNEIGAVAVNRIDDVLALLPDALLYRVMATGMDPKGGGSWERPQIILIRFGADGLVVRMETFEADAASEALARFDLLTAEPVRPARRVRPNDATAHAVRLDAAIAARDRDAITDLLSERSRLVDYTTASSYDERADALATFDGLWRSRDPSYRNEPLATLGDSLALCSITASGSGVPGELDTGAWELERIGLLEVGADGRRERLEIFGGDRLGAAIARLYERYAERLAEGAARTRAAAVARSLPAVLDPFDPDRLAAVLAPDAELCDHRALIGIGPERGKEAITRSFRAVAMFVDDVSRRVEDVVAAQPEALLIRAVTGGRDRATGGEYEWEILNLVVFDTDGLIARTEWFDTDREADALARFDALLAASSDPLRIPPNAASRAVIRAMEVLADGEVGPSAAISHDFVFEDRGRRALVRGGPEQGRATLEFYQQQGGHPTRELIGTRGDRISIERNTWSGNGFEIDYIGLVELDEAGKIRTSIRFDADDRAAAFEEAEKRFSAGEAAETGGQALFAALASASHRRDWEAMRRFFADDAVVRDHRILGVGAATADALIAAAAAMGDLSPDALVETLRLLTWNAQGRVAVNRMFGSGMGGGGPFENFSIVLMLRFGDRIQHFEVFDIDAGDAALARFDELCAERDPLHVPPNTASGTGDRVLAAIAAHELGAARALIRGDFSYEDRGKRALTGGDVELWFESIEYYQALGGRRSRERIATRGDRIELNRVAWTGNPGGSEYEIEFIALFEVDAEGKLCAAIRFDADDRVAAIAEAERRFVSGEAAGIAGQAVFGELDRMAHLRDWEAMRHHLTDDFATRDHRVLGVGAESGDELIASLRAQAELSPDVDLQVVRILAWNAHGRVMVMHRTGTALHGGGAFESSNIGVWLTRGDRVQRIELFDIGAADAALARFTQLCAERD